MIATLSLPTAFDFTSLQHTPTVRVRSADDMRNALRRARERALTLDGSGMDRVLHLDAQRGLVEVQAGTPWPGLASYLATRGIALGAYANIAATVGESVAQAAPGPDGRPVCAHVAALTLFTPDGEMRRADRNMQQELFSLALGGHGVIGLLYSVTLSTGSLASSAAAATPPVDLRIRDESPASAPECTIECLLPPAALDAYLNDVRLIAEERRIVLHGITVRRYEAEAGTGLRWATRQWAGVEVRFNAKTTLAAAVAAAEVRRALLAAALGHGGSFPIRDLRDVTRAQLECCYPSVRAFLADKRRVDPAERLQNPWYRRLVTILRGETCDVRWAR